MKSLAVGGVTPFTTIDFPGGLAAVVFCQGCPWRCAYCHNPDLIPGSRDGLLSWDEMRVQLSRRRGFLDAVVLSGGEPTAQESVLEAARDVRALGFKVGLHTGGAYPRRLARLLPLVDWVGMDVKAPFHAYEALTGVAGSGERARQSLALVLESGVACEVRTTVHPDFLPEAELLALAGEVAAMGVREYAVQRFRTQGCANPAYASDCPADFPGPEARRALAGLFERFSLRPA